MGFCVDGYFQNRFFFNTFCMSRKFISACEHFHLSLIVVPVKLGKILLPCIPDNNNNKKKH